MNERLNVIALISGGKDSFFSMLHCMKLGHKIVALGNLYPPRNLKTNEDEGELDMNSFMYQTVGHTVIPLYEKALNIPLYREPIVGSAIHTGASYEDSDHDNSNSRETPNFSTDSDETECLVPLLKRILRKHPSANALNTGAIFSTYQRTRVEAIARRLGLLSLSYLWQYPSLSLKNEVSLIQEMGSVELDARIVKVAGSDLDESFLWQNITNKSTLQQLQKAQRKYGVEDYGAILGEGGEFETLVLDGPSYLFKGRIEVKDCDRIIVRENCGSAWLKILEATVLMKDNEGSTNEVVRIPDVLEPRFCEVIEVLRNARVHCTLHHLPKWRNLSPASQSLQSISTMREEFSMTQWTLVAPTRFITVSEEAEYVRDIIKSQLDQVGLRSIDIVSTMILLRSMNDFTVVNGIYSTLFPRPNPPSRVTICCGDGMPPKVNLIIHLTISVASLINQRRWRRGLHVQSYSYWAPANIGPYSQAIITNVADDNKDFQIASIAGQIPLIPHTMQLATSQDPSQSVPLQIALSLQHLWRIGMALEVRWWTSVIAYLPHDTAKDKNQIPEAVIMAIQAWVQLHTGPESREEMDEEEFEEPDLWEERYHAQMRNRGQRNTPSRNCLPDWSLLRISSKISSVHLRDLPPFFAIEVDSLPRESAIEWHAQSGIICGSRQSYIGYHIYKEDQSEWSVYQCIVDKKQVQLIITIRFTEDISHFHICLRQAQSYVGLTCDRLDKREGLRRVFPASLDFSTLEAITCSGFSYRDISLSSQYESVCENGVIPCHRLWDFSGQRLAYLWIYNTL